MGIAVLYCVTVPNKRILPSVVVSGVTFRHGSFAVTSANSFKVVI